VSHSRIIVLGSINMDVVVTAPRHPQLGETVFGDDFHFVPGGKGSNQAVAAKRLGADVMLIGRLGRDAFGTSLQAFLQSEAIDMRSVTSEENVATGTALITVSHTSENTIVVVSGANARLTDADVSTIEITQDDIVISQFEVSQKAIYKLFQRARAVGATTILNPAPAVAFIDGLLPLVSFLVLNETELALLTQTPRTDDIDGLLRTARSLQAVSHQSIVITIGARGALYLKDDEAYHIPSPIVEAVDTTGAGDCFVGALAVALSEKKQIDAALAFANCAASISVQRLGAAPSLPKRQELDDLFRQRLDG